MLPKQYVIISLQLQEEFFELAYALTSDLSGFLGAEEGFDLIKLTFDTIQFSETELNDFISELSLQTGKKISFEKSFVEEQNWNAEWESTIKPLVIDDYFCIYPSWSKPEKSYPVSIEIDPKMSFGTGYHETTRLMLQSIKSIDLKGKTILDCGTGTGVLAIAAIILNAESCFAFDIDEWSYENSVENAEKNSVSEKIKFVLGGYEVIPIDKKYEIILANVNKNIHTEFGDYYSTHIQKNGMLILSGLLKYDENQMMDLFLEKGFIHQFTNSENEWICMGFSK